MNGLIESQAFRLDEDGLCRQLSIALPSRLRDLLQIAMQVYVADRLTKRNGRTGLSGPSRCMPPVKVPVSEPEFWRSKPIESLLRRAVEFISDDNWDFQFEFRKPLAERQGSLSFRDETICLYSGGLDSAAGLANRLMETKTPIIAVTAQHQAGQKKVILDQLSKLRKRFGNRISSVMVRTTLRCPPPMGSQELTQRCRSFLFGSLAGVVACACDAQGIEVYENGVGIINVPLMTGMMVGARATKSAHPEFLRRMSDLLSAVAKRPIHFLIPFRDKTKAELVRALADDPEMAEVARNSVSCVHYPRRVRGARKHCGACPGCIGRRQALLSAGIHDPSGNYELDIFGDVAEVNSIPASELNFLKAIIVQIDAFRNLRYDEPLPLAVRSHLAQVLDRGEDIRPTINVLRRYRDEWLELINVGQQCGRKWAEWYGPIHSVSVERSVA